MITIEKIYKESDGNNIRLVADININHKYEKLWFETEKEYGKFFCHEKADAFIIGLLPYAMKCNYNIMSKIPISEKLHYNLTEHYIPVISSNTNLNKISISASTCCRKLETQNGVGTGNSGGVDSFYTIYRHDLESCTNNYKITHLTFLNVGASGDFGGERSRLLYKERMNFVKPFSDNHNYNFVSVDSNISEILKMSYIPTHTYRNAAAILSLQKLFSVYYYSAGYTVDEFSIDSNAPAKHDLFSLSCFSNENVQFYSTGPIKRMEKIKEIVKYKPSQKYLNVCISDGHNCSHCEKCIRTMLALYVINKLEDYNNVFDIEDFHRNKNRYFGLLIAKKKSSSYYNEIFIEMDRNKIEPPFFSHFYVPLYKSIEVKKKLVTRLSNNKIIRKIYRKYVKAG
ncbi:hypothetical protein CN902_26575 [Priestia megaterium]|uniref:hypothetical protein n=1 Tax=Priestia megaterium TaxID=1404 RepID=UPI000BFCC4D2|nr:hypothetical protein [Priestia megaterium]PGK22470.1 hypothetical protein CN902_26575 [Priestia megaterium]